MGRPHRQPLPPSDAAPDWLTPKQAAARLRVSVDMIYDACRNRRLQYSKQLGRSTIRIKPAWLEEYAESGAQ